MFNDFSYRNYRNFLHPVDCSKSSTPHSDAYFPGLRANQGSDRHRYFLRKPSLASYDDCQKQLIRQVANTISTYKAIASRAKKKCTTKLTDNVIEYVRRRQNPQTNSCNALLFYLQILLPVVTFLTAHSLMLMRTLTSLLLKCCDTHCRASTL